MTNNQTDNRNQTGETKLPALIAYHVAERSGKHYWTRIGAAWDHDDAKGLTVVLDLVPTNSDRIVLRQPGQSDDQADEERG